MAGVDHTEAIAVRIGQHDEVRVGRIHVPRHTCGAEADEAIDRGSLLGSIVDDEVDVDPRMVLRRRFGALHRDPHSLARRWAEDDEPVVIGEAHGLVAEHLRPERHRTIHILDAEHDTSKS